MRQTVVGIFQNENEAQNAVQQLINDGFDRQNIDVAMNSRGSNLSDPTNTGYVSDASTSSRYNDKDNDEDFGDKVSRFFRNLFGDDDNDNVRNYSEVAKKGSVVTVHAESKEQAERAADILDLYGAVDVDESARQFSNTSTSDSELYDTDNINTNRTDMDYRANVNDDEAKFNVVEEDLQVGKREVETGGVRLRSRVVERPVEENLRLRVERVNVERNPVNRPATEADFNNFSEGTVEITERAEVPVVNKEARVVEEVRVGKEVDERVETIRDTVRRTDVDVENLDRNIDLDADNDRKRFRDND